MSDEKPFLSGTLQKLGGGAIQRLQPRTFHIFKTTQTLVYFEEGGGGGEKGTIDLSTATIVDRGNYIDNKPCFTVEGVNTVKNTRKLYFLFAETKDVKWKWVNALMHVSDAYKRCSPLEEDPSANWARIKKTKLAQQQLPSPVDVAKDPTVRNGNGLCCDCGAPTPTWGVVLGGATNDANLGGCFVCIDCVGVHRSMWPDRCLEVEMDQWSTKQIDKMAMGGNTKVNASLQASYICEDTASGISRPNRYSTTPVRTTFIQAKYFADPTTKNVVGKFSKAANSSSSNAKPFASIPKDDANSGARIQQLMTQLPPRYCGLLGITVESAVALPSSPTPLSALFEAPETLIVCFTNGYQEVSTMGGSSSSSIIKAGGNGLGGCEWNQEIQIGTDAPTRPIYGSVWCCGGAGSSFSGNGGPSASDGTSKKVLIGTIEIIPSAIMAAADGKSGGPAPIMNAEGHLLYKVALAIILPPVSSSSSSEGNNNNAISAGVSKIGSFLKAKAAGGGSGKVASGSEGQMEAGHMSIGLVFNRMA